MRWKRGGKRDGKEKGSGCLVAVESVEEDLETDATTIRVLALTWEIVVVYRTKMRDGRGRWREMEGDGGTWGRWREMERD